MKDTTKNIYFERMHTVLLHIQHHLDDDLTLESLAELTFFSPIHFHRIFKGMFGETVIEHIRRIRLERAAIQLFTNTASVTDAAFGARYETVESFSRAFKKMFGCPPSKYREHHWARFFEKQRGAVHYLPENARNALVPPNLKEMTMDVQVKTIDPMRVAFVRHVGPYIECEAAWRTLCDWAGPKGLINETARFLGICYDDPQVTPPEKIRYDACITVAPQTEGQGEVGIQTIDGGEYAVALHKGPYEHLELTYAELMGQWLPHSGREFGDHTSFEVYLNTPDATPPDQLLTEIYLPLK